MGSISTILFQLSRQKGETKELVPKDNHRRAEGDSIALSVRGHEGFPSLE